MACPDGPAPPRRSPPRWPRRDLAGRTALGAPPTHSLRRKVIHGVLGGDSRWTRGARPARPRHLRRALIARDQGCAFPGCDRPPAWSEAHHIQHWADGGDTSLANLVLLCRYHHNVIHHTPWTVRIDKTTGQPVFTAPGGIEHRSGADTRRQIEQLARPPDPPPDP